MGTAWAKLMEDIEEKLAWCLLHGTFFEEDFTLNRGYLRVLIIYILLMTNFLGSAYCLRNCATVTRCREEDYWPIMEKLITVIFIRCFQLMSWQETVFTPVGFLLLFGCTFFPSILLLQIPEEVVLKALKATTMNVFFISVLAVAQNRTSSPFGGILIGLGLWTVVSSYLSGFLKVLLFGSWHRGPFLYHGVILTAYGIYFDQLVHLKNSVNQRLTPDHSLSRIPFMSCLLYGLSLTIIYLQIKAIMEIASN